MISTSTPISLSFNWSYHYVLATTWKKSLHIWSNKLIGFFKAIMWHRTYMGTFLWKVSTRTTSESMILIDDRWFFTYANIYSRSRPHLDSLTNIVFWGVWNDCYWCRQYIYLKGLLCAMVTPRTKRQWITDWVSESQLSLVLFQSYLPVVKVHRRHCFS